MDGSIVSSSHFRMPDQIRKWPGACRVLGSLQHLRELQIIIALWCDGSLMSSRPASDDDSVLYILQPLKEVQARQFTVTLTEDVSTSVRSTLGVTPYQLLRREMPGIGYEGFLWDY